MHSRPLRVIESALGILSALVWLDLLLVAPVEWGAWSAAAFARVSIELALFLALIALAAPLRGGLARPVRHLAAVTMVLVVALKLGELTTRGVLGRPLNLVLDVHLLSALRNVVTGSVGIVPVLCGAVAVLAAIMAVYVLSLRAVRMVQHVLDRHAVARAAALGLGAGMAGLAVVASAWPGAVPAPIQRLAERLIAQETAVPVAGQWRQAATVFAELDRFRAAEAVDPMRAIPPDRLLARLRGVDVLVLFVESYGRSSLEDPRYAPTTGPALAAFERTLSEHGLSAVSGWFASATIGGESWLAHGTLQSGLWLDSLVRYDLMIAGSRWTLSRYFGAAGWRTVTGEPAMTLPWPEGEHFGFDQIYRTPDFHYAGLPYSWVAMPDQYILSFLQRTERDRHDTPLFLQVALLSSHSPWTQIPPVLDDWGTIGDGAIFATWAHDGDPPEIVWQDFDRVRRQYIRSIDYTLQVLAGYAAQYVDDRTLVIVLGDHQPLPLITGEGAGRDVPVHVLSGDPALLAPFRDWGFADGMRPPHDAPVRSMADFRDWFLSAYTSLP